MAAESNPRIVEDVTCLACGCLCDDLVVRVEQGRITEARNACELGRGWFLANPSRTERPSTTIEGRAVPADEAVDRAATILGGARLPVVLGLSRTTIESQAAVVGLADRIGATIDPGNDLEASARLLAVQRVGRVSATLGEVKNRADLVVFWGVDPVATHPRHWERYSVEPKGRFVPEGRAGRFVVVVDADRTATSERADLFLLVRPEARIAALTTLRGLVREARLDPEQVESATGRAFDDWRALANRMIQARYGVVFFGANPERTREGAAHVEAVLSLVRDLNRSTRFVAMTLGGPGNVSGAEAVLTWQSGYPFGVDFSRGFPRFLPGEATARNRLARGDADAALIVADDPRTWLPDEAIEALKRIPSVVIAPDATDPSRGPMPTVGLASATPGINATGTVMRVDGLTLPLRPALHADRPTDRAWLEAIEARLSLRLGSG